MDETYPDNAKLRYSPDFKLAHNLQLCQKNRVIAKKDYKMIRFSLSNICISLGLIGSLAFTPVMAQQIGSLRFVSEAPAEGAVLHIVQKGETLYGIARK